MESIPPVPPAPPMGGWFGTGDPLRMTDRELGAQVPMTVLLVRTNDVAVWLSDFTAYHKGVAFTLCARRRVPPAQPRGAGYPRFELGDDTRHDRKLLLGVELPDGRVATNLPPLHGHRPPWERPSGSEQLELRQKGGSMSPTRMDQDYFLSPVPPDGPLVFVCRWQDAGVEEVQVRVSDALLMEASGRAEFLWPEPPQPPPTPMTPPEPTWPTTGWFGEAVRRADPPA